jgi:hypothetical protein
MPRPTGVLGEPYRQLQILAAADLKSVETSAQILKLALVALNFLHSECRQVELISCVADKKYCAYHVKATPKLLSRPINAGLWEPDSKKIADWWKKWRANKKMDVIELAKVTYTVAMAYCVSIDLFDRNNKKGPASFFEYYIGHLYAVEIGVNPATAVRFPIGTKQVRLTMDLLFLPKNSSKVHVAVKMSTRERVVQAWAHHRILDAVYGAGEFRGFLTVFAETKLDLQTRQVVEICVPDQWLAYQTYISRMDRIYYFDVPQRYIELAKQFPIITLKQFGQFFVEKEEVLRPLPRA